MDAYHPDDAFMQQTPFTLNYSTTYPSLHKQSPKFVQHYGYHLSVIEK